MDSKWTAIWGCAASRVEGIPENYAKDITLRYTIKSVFNGSALRLHFSNFCSHESVTISKVYVAPEINPGEADNTKCVRVTFGGRYEAVMESGGGIVSDSIPFEVHKNENICISMYFDDFTEMATGSVFSHREKYMYALGDHAADSVLPINKSREINRVYFLETVDVVTDLKNHAVIVYGDSITALQWPDFLADRALENETDCSIIRRAVSGSRILHQYECLEYMAYGLSGFNRFKREILADGAKAVIVLHGINDLIHPDGINPFRPMSEFPTAEELIEGLRFYVLEAHKKGLKIYLATIMPIEGWRTYEVFRNDVRIKVNEWIRTTNEIDGVIDFDKALRNPNNPNALLPAYDSSDHLHPSEEGSKRLADEVNLEVLK